MFGFSLMDQWNSVNPQQLNRKHYHRMKMELFAFSANLTWPPAFYSSPKRFFLVCVIYWFYWTDWLASQLAGWLLEFRFYYISLCKFDRICITNQAELFLFSQTVASDEFVYVRSKYSGIYVYILYQYFYIPIHRHTQYIRVLILISIMLCWRKQNSIEVRRQKHSDQETENFTQAFLT